MKSINLSFEVDRFKATIKKEKDILEKTLSNDSGIELYVQAIYLGYLDASRTFEGQRKVKKDDSEVEAIATEMKQYIDGHIADFDALFYKACETLCDKYQMKFGQAQKIINMAYKYLYCIACEDLKKRFDKCHLPLDGIMLEWIHRNITDAKMKRLKKVDAWSKLVKGTEDEACTYMYYKKYIDSYCKEKGKTPLQLDFEYWVIMSQTLSAESYLKTFSEEELKENKHIELLKRIQR